MTLPTSGQIDLYQISQEFGGPSSNIGLSSFYAGGAYVPAGVEGINGPIPSSGQIEISDFYGAPIEDTIQFNSYWETGPDNTGTYPQSTPATGYTYVYDQGEVYGYVSPADARMSAEGWGIDGITLWEYETGFVVQNRGWAISFFDNLWSNRFRFTVGLGTPQEKILDTNDATTDTTTSVDHPGGNKLIRWCFWDENPVQSPSLIRYDSMNNRTNIILVERLT